jgi:hypothetical protein
MPEIQMKLKTTIKSTQQCVERDPPKINAHKRDVDVVKITNVDPSGAGSAITVTLDPKTLGNVFVNPPSGPQILKPGDSLQLTVKQSFSGPQSEGFTTIPPSCQHHDVGDIVIQP